MRLLNQDKQKTLCFVVATKDGEFPAVPQKRAGDCVKQIPVCKKYRPDLDWHTYEIVQVTRVENGFKKTDPPFVLGAKQELQARLLNAIRERHEAWSWL